MTLAAALNVHYHNELGATKTAVLAVVLCALISAFSGMLVSIVRLSSIIVTLAMNTLLAGVLVQWLGQTYSQDGSAPSWLIDIGRKDIGRVNAIFLIGLVVAGIAAFVLYRTRVGRSVAAAGANRAAAQLLGIRVHLVHIITFAAAGALYAVAGSLTAGFVQTPDATLGSTYQLQTLTAVAIAGVVFSGGPASVSSVVAACLLLQTLDQALTLQHLDSGVRVLIQGVLLVLAVAAGAIAKVGREAFRHLNHRRGAVTASP
jgi:ribose transport system permease protein